MRRDSKCVFKTISQTRGAVLTDFRCSLQGYDVILTSVLGAADGGRAAPAKSQAERSTERSFILVEQYLCGKLYFFETVII